MRNFLNRIKGSLISLFNSKPAKVLKTAAYIAGGLMVLSCLMNVMAYAVTSFKGLAKAVLS
jgi:hypothetical protein